MGFSLSRYLNVSRSERPRLAWLYAMLFASVIGVVWGEAVIEAGFLRNVGVQYLPLAIVGSALLSMGTISIYNLFADRVANHKLLVAILIACILGIGVSLLFLVKNQVLIAFPFLYILDTIIFRDLLNVHWPVYVNGFYDTQSAKRIFPVLASASRLAAIIGGLSMPVLNRNLSPTGIITIMLLMQSAMLIMAVLMRRNFKDRTTPAAASLAQAQPHAAMDHIREGYRYVIGSGYLRWIAAATLLMMVLLAYINYQTGRLLLDNLHTVQNIANFMGLLSAAGNLIALPLQLFYLSRVIARAGVGNAAIIYPSASFLAVSWLSWVPSLFTAGFGYLTRTVLRTTFMVTVDGLLYNAVPLRLKARARGFISGYVMTAGSLVGGLLLIFLTRQPNGLLLAVLFSSLALAYLVSALQVKRQYGKAVVAMIEQEDFISLLAPSDIELSTVDDTTFKQLVAKMNQPGISPDLKVFFAQVICSVGEDQAVKVLDDTLQQASDERLRARLVEALAVYSTNPAHAEPTFVRSLSDPEKEVRKAALAGLERCCADNLTRLQALVTPLLGDAEIEVRAAALSAIILDKSAMTQPAATQVLDDLLTSKDADLRAQGVHILGRFIENLDQQVDYTLIYQLTRSFRDPSDEVRLTGALSLEGIVEKTGSVPKWLPLELISQLLCDPVERVRCTAAGLLGKSLQPEVLRMLVEALKDTSSVVRMAVINSLAQRGPEVTALIKPLLDSENYHTRTASAMILTRIDPVQYAPIILSSYLPCQLQAMVRSWGYMDALGSAQPSPVLNLLHSALLEQNTRRIDEIFSVLRTLFPPSAVDKIAAALRSPDPLKRANALEALEVMTSPKITRVLGLLCEQPADTKAILALGSATWGIPTPDFKQAIQELQASSDDPWISEIAIIAGSSGIPA